jgi:hypothetical protein
MSSDIRCTTHHYACRCREIEFARLLREVMATHADAESPDYNGCDDDPCEWCEDAAKLLRGYPHE